MNARNSWRRGTATVELAVCLPVIVLLVCGSIQACNLMQLKHALVSAAYEGSLEVAKSGSTNTSVRNRVNRMLALRGVTGAQVSLRPSGLNLSMTAVGTPISIRVTAPTAQNLLMRGFFATSKNTQYELSLTR